jgi:hypothetical protein
MVGGMSTSMAAAGDQPVRVELAAPTSVARWRPFVQWLLAIPQLIIAYGLRALREALLVVSFFAVLFTKQIPRPIFDMVAMTYRYEWRVLTYLAFLRETYPPFDFTPVSDDPGNDPARYSIDYPPQLNRWLPLVKWLLALPHVVVLAFLTVGATLVSLAAAFVVLFTGEYPQPMRDFVVGVMRWGLRVEAYVFFMTDRYPPFTLRPNAAGTGVAMTRAPAG